MADDSSARTPTPEFTYQTTQSNLSTPAYTSVNDDTIPGRAESTSNQADSSGLPLDVGVPGYTAGRTLDDATTLPDDTSAPTQLDPSDMRSDIFVDISEEQSKSQTAVFQGYDDGFNLGLDIDPDLDLDLDMVLDYQYDAMEPHDRTSSDSNSLLAKKTESFDFVIEIDQEEIKEESSASEESTPTALDREPYFTQFMDSVSEYSATKRLNNVLHKKMTDYFRKRKMDHVLIEVAHPEEAYIKYGKKLDHFAKLRALDMEQRKKLSAELSVLRQTKKKQCTEATEYFQALLDRELQIGIGLINTKTGKEISPKIIQRLVAAQASKADELRKLRLLHITVRNTLADKTSAIKALDKIGDNYTLMEFEQMKVEHQSNVDKMEDRDDELIRMRKQCRHAVQSLAHVREKCSSTEDNIRLLREALLVKESEKTEVREGMNRLKQERDFFRLETQRLKDENGLLTKDRLLVDMENAMQSIEKLQKTNEEKRQKLVINKERLVYLRRHYENELQKRMNVNRLMRAHESAITNVPDAKKVAMKKKRNARPNPYLGDRPSIIRPRFGCELKCKSDQGK